MGTCSWGQHLLAQGSSQDRQKNMQYHPSKLVSQLQQAQYSWQPEVQKPDAPAGHNGSITADAKVAAVLTSAAKPAHPAIKILAAFNLHHKVRKLIRH